MGQKITVAQLIEQLRDFPQEAEVYVGTNCCGCFAPVDHIRQDDRGMVVIEDEA